MKGIGDIILSVELDIRHHTRLRFVSFAVLCRKKKKFRQLSIIF